MKKFLMLVCGICALLFSGACSTPDQQTADLPDGTILIDVRTEAEFSEKFIPGTILIPHDKIAQKISEKAPDKNTPIALFCRSGRRSAIAGQTLTRLGYKNVTDLGGIDDAAKKLKKDIIVNKK